MRSDVSGCCPVPSADCAGPILGNDCIGGLSRLAANQDNRIGGTTERFRSLRPPKHPSRFVPGKNPVENLRAVIVTLRPLRAAVHNNKESRTVL